MTLPTRTRIELPLLKIIDDAGGELRPKDAYEQLLRIFLEVTPADLDLETRSGRNRWKNTIQWTRQQLIDTGFLVRNDRRDPWKISPKGRERLHAAPTPVPGRKSGVTLGDNESDLYEPIRGALENVLPNSRELHLEITATGISRKMQKKLDDAAFLFLKSEKNQPDLMGYLKEEVSNLGLRLGNRVVESLVMAEVKNDEIRIPDIYQTKRYAEVFETKYAFLISSEEIPEEVKRFVRNRPNVLKFQDKDGPREIIYGQFKKEVKEIEIEEF